MPVLEPIEDARRLETPPGLLRVLERRELEEDEDVVRVVDAPEDALRGRVRPRPRHVSVEQRPPGVVVADWMRVMMKADISLLSLRGRRASPQARQVWPGGWAAERVVGVPSFG